MCAFLQVSFRERCVRRAVAVLGMLALLASFAHGALVVETGSPDGSRRSVAVAAARLAGWYAEANVDMGGVSVMDVTGRAVQQISGHEIHGLLPGRASADGPVGVGGLAFSDSGRLLFIAAYAKTTLSVGSPDAGAVLCHDTFTGVTRLFARFPLAAPGEARRQLPVVHFRGRLYVGTPAGVQVYRAEAGDEKGLALGRCDGPGGAAVRGLAVDAQSAILYAAGEDGLYRAPIGSGAPAAWTRVGALANAGALAYAGACGDEGASGLWVAAGPRLFSVTETQCRGLAAFAPVCQFQADSVALDVAATACGRLMVADGYPLLWLRDAADPRLSYEAWRANEFAQCVAFARGLISPDGEQPGWVIDADVQAGAKRYHPATPDAAFWAVALLTVQDALNDGTANAALVGRILARYGGTAGDCVAPRRSADGIYLHWIDPVTGGSKPGWDHEFATMSTMQLCKGAALTRDYYAGNADVKTAASRILDGVRNWGRYFAPFSGALRLCGSARGGAFELPVAPAFNEGLLFAELAAAYGHGQATFDHWLDRSRWPVVETVPGFPITSNRTGEHLPAFVSIYPQLLVHRFREDEAWQTHMRNLQVTSAAWCDDHAPRWYTVFSAGTTRADWAGSGYHADSLSHHPGDISTFPALLGFCAGGGSALGVAAYHAYRMGARQRFSGGAELLYRRSNEDPAYLPDSAGLPDVAMGALGLAELERPGLLDRVLAAPL